MAITVIAGPVDKLNQGLIAGLRFGALKTRQKALEAQNKVALGHLKVAQDNSANLENHRIAQLEDDKSQARLQEAQAELAKQATVTSKSKNVSARQEASRDLLAASLDPTAKMTMADAEAMVLQLKPQLDALGVPEEEIVRSAYATQLLGLHSQEREKNRIQEILADSLARSRNALAESKIDPVSLGRIRTLGDMKKELVKARTANDSFFSAIPPKPEDPKGAQEWETRYKNVIDTRKALDAQEQVLEAEEFELMRIQGGGAPLSRSRQPAPRVGNQTQTVGRANTPVTKAPPGTKFVFVTNQAQYDNLPPGTFIKFVTPDGRVITRVKE